MNRIIKISLLVTSSLSANDALDLLDRESDTAANVYQEAALTPIKQEADGVAKAKLEPINPRFPDRWRHELEPKFPLEVGRETIIAPRGLFEYQSYNRDGLDNSKLSRARLGLAVQSRYGVEFLADALLSSSAEFQGWETLRASVSLNDHTRLTVGKFPPAFSTEYSRDASVRWFPTLSPLAAQLAPASSLGAMVESRKGSLDWSLGWFSSDSARNVPSFDGKGYILASVGQEFNRAGKDGAPRAHYQGWHLDYLHNMDGSESRSIPQGYRDMISLGGQYSAGGFDFYTELMAGRSSANTAYGVTAAGRYWLLQDAVSLVARYQYARSQEPGGIYSNWGIPETGSDSRFPTNFQATTAGSQLTSFYSGVNVHFDDDNLILGTGLEYRALSDRQGGEGFDSWGWNTFARYAF